DQEPARRRVRGGSGARDAEDADAAGDGRGREVGRARLHVQGVGMASRELSPGALEPGSSADAGQGVMASSVTVARVQRRPAADLLELTKPRITLMVVLTSLVGFIMASSGPLDGRALVA